MNRSSAGYVTCLLTVCAGLCAAPASRADALSVVQRLRAGGCGGIAPAASLLEPNASLNRTAALWAKGFPLRVALARGGYPGRRASGLRVTGPDKSVLALIRRSGCRGILSLQLHDIGVYQFGSHAWVVVASPSAAVLPAHAFVRSRELASAPSGRSTLAARALRLVNQARARGTRCGRRFFPPAPALRLSGVLSGVALGHALDMAQRGYFDHEDPRGESPADRVRAVGYLERLVGENIAYGTQSIEETVEGWLASPGHCENIMDRRFSEMGIADATGSTSRRGPYWVELLAEPNRAPARKQ